MVGEGPLVILQAGQVDDVPGGSDSPTRDGQSESRIIRSLAE